MAPRTSNAVLLLAVGVRGKRGKGSHLRGLLDGLAKDLYENAPGCYSAYVVRERGTLNLVSLSWWQNRVYLARGIQRVNRGGWARALGELSVEPPSLRDFEGHAGSSPRSTMFTYVGIRVRDFERSMKFYTELIGLVPVSPPGGNPKLRSKIALLSDPISGERLELNWYPEGSQFGTRFMPGDNLDHIGFRVNNVKEFLVRARGFGAEPIDLRPLRSYPTFAYPSGDTGAFIADPDGNQIEVYGGQERRVRPRRDVNDPYAGGY